MIRIGLIGAGWVAEQHLAALKQIEDIKVTAIFNPTRSKAEALAASCGAAVYDTHSGVIQNVDVVFALAPQDVRPAMVIEAARAGKHVFCEKPFALTLSEADRQIEAIERAGVKAFVGFVMRYFATFALVHDAFKTGEFGDLVTAWTRRAWFRDLPEGHYQRSMARSGGLTTELNVHDFDWLRWVGGDVQSVYGRTARTRMDRDVEENSWSILNFDRGFGVVGTSWLCTIPNTSAGIIGTRGTILLDGSTVIQKVTEAGDEKRVPFADETLMPNAFLAQDREFLAEIRENRPPTSSIYDGRAATEIALAVLESARCNQVVSVA